MLSAELASLDARRDRGLPDDQMWDALHDKSALPLWAMAVSAAPAALPTGHALAAVRANVVSIGELLWIVDDLLDAPGDWLAGVWSRPWALRAESVGGSPHTDPSDALADLLDSSVIDEEARGAATRARLAIRTASQRSGCTLAESLGTSVESWLRGAEVEARDVLGVPPARLA
jgi:hypothetical protein